MLALKQSAGVVRLLQPPLAIRAWHSTKPNSTQLNQTQLNSTQLHSTQLTCESESTTDTTLVNVLQHNKHTSSQLAHTSTSLLLYKLATEKHKYDTVRFNVPQNTLQDILEAI